MCVPNMLAENELFSSSCCMSVPVLFKASVTSDEARNTASSCWLIINIL